MTSDNNGEYKYVLHKLLTEEGFEFRGNSVVSENIYNVCNEFEFLIYNNNKFEFIFTSGCRLFCDKGAVSRDEFVIIYENHDSKLLLEYASYFYITNRSINYTDCLLIGNNIGCHHSLYSSVPFFLPRNINELRVGGYVHYLQWLVPINETNRTIYDECGPGALELFMNLNDPDMYW